MNLSCFFPTNKMNLVWSVKSIGYEWRKNEIVLSQNYLAIEDQNCLTIFDIKKGEKLCWYTYKNYISTICISPNEKYIVCATGSNQICVHKIEEFRQHVSINEILNGHTDIITVLCFSPNSRYLISGSDDCTIKVWSLESWTCLKTLVGHQNRILCLCFSRNGEMFASSENENHLEKKDDGECAEKGVVKIWSSKTWNCVCTIKNWIKKMEKKSLRFSLDGTQLLIDQPNSKPLFLNIFTRHKQPSNPIPFSCSISYSSDDRYFICVGDNFVKLVSVVSGEQVFEAHIPCCDASNGRFLLTKYNLKMELYKFCQTEQDIRTEMEILLIGLHQQKSSVSVFEQSDLREPKLFSIVKKFLS